MHENQVATEMGDAIRKEIVMLIHQIETVNKEPITPEDKNDALNELKERIAAAI